jgi:hypothetical protein
MKVDKERYARDGFLVFDRLLSAHELAPLQDAFEELFTTATDGSRMWGGLTPQVMMPCLHHEAFMQSAALEVGADIATQLLGVEVVRTFDMLIYKPPGHPYATPWHQDMAYAEMPFAPGGAEIPEISLQLWFALDDVDVENGCMHFVPGVHRGLLCNHAIVSGDGSHDSRLLGIIAPEDQLPLREAVACPLAAGGATLHSYGTPHFTPPNRSLRPRRAYVINYAMVPIVDFGINLMIERLEEAGRTEIVQEVRSLLEGGGKMMAMNRLTPFFREFIRDAREAT